MQHTSFLPPVSSLISLDDLPESLLFLQGGLEQVFDDIYFKDLQFNRSARGDGAYYSLTLVLYKKAGFTVPGAEIEILLNPDYDGTGHTDIPITFQYDWKLLGLLREISSFSIDQFAADAQAFFDLLRDILGLDQNRLVEAAVAQFKEDADPIDAVNAFVADINAHYNANVPPALSAELEDAIVEVLDNATQAVPKNPFEIVYEVYIDDLDLETALGNVNQLFIELLGGEEPIEYLKSLLIPKIAASLQVGLGVAFPRSYLTPLDPNNNLEPIADPAVRSMLNFDAGKVLFHTESGIGFDESLTARLNHPSQIGNTGLILDLQNAKLDLSTTKNIPEADLDGRPLEFVGVFIELVSIRLPEKWFQQQDETTARIVGRNLLLGTGGISGTLALEAVGAAPNAALTAKLGNNAGFEIGFRSFDITFRQNAITASKIEGFLKIAGFKDAGGNDARIDIKVHIDDDGDFSITASEAQGIRLLRIPDILDLKIKSLSLGREAQKFFLALSGTLDFADQSGGGSGFIANNLPKDIEIQKIVIWEDGRFEFEGGSLELRQPLSMKIGPVDFSVTALHFGSHTQAHNGVDRQYNFFGFDGGLSIKPGGVDARGDGIKFYFTVDNGPGKPLHVFLRIESIAIDLMIPGDAKPETAALLLSGYLAMKEPSDPNAPGAGTEYAGGISFTLPKLQMGGTAAMRYNPKLPSFLIDVGFEIPTPIPLGPTGLGLYGFRGLIGSRYVASKGAAGLGENAKWYEYYKAKVAPDYKEGIQASKFEARPGFSVGAGVSLATATDSGKVFSAKVFFLLSLPEAFLIEGQGQILKERIGLDSKNDPPFYAFIAITSESVETALGANYNLPEQGDSRGKIVKVTGVIEIAFFFGNAQAWYVNIGRDQPEEKRLRSRIFDLFDSYLFLMISSAGIRAGAGVSYHLRKKFGPLRAELNAYLDVYGELSFKPVQIGGSIQIGGSLALSLFGVGFSLSAEAGLAAEAPRPFIISGRVRACVKVLWKKACAKFNFTWNFSTALNTDEIGLLDTVLESSVKALHMKTRETFELHAQRFNGALLPAPDTWPDIDRFVIPLDSFIDIEFKEGVTPLPGSASMEKIGGLLHASNHSILVPPKKGKSEQVRHRFLIEAVNIKCWNESGRRWEDYDPYDAITAFDHPAVFTDPPDPSLLKAGYWQDDHPTQYNKIRLLSQTPLHYLVAGRGESRPAETELWNLTVEKLFCEDKKREKRCVSLRDAAWRDRARNLYVPESHWIYRDGVLFRITEGRRGEVISRPFADHSHALVLRAQEELTLRFTEPTPCVELTLQTDAPSLRVFYYQWVRTSEKDENGLAIYGDRLLETRPLGPAQLTQKVTYEDADQPVDKVVILAGTCAQQGGPGPDTDPGSSTGSGPDEFGPCEEKPTEEGPFLEAFLKALARYEDLLKDELQLFPKALARYREVFFETALYGKPSRDNPVLYRAKIEDKVLRILLSDKKKLDCEIRLSVLKPDELFRFDRIAALKDLRPHAAKTRAGLHHDFLIDAVVRTRFGERTYELEGISCYPIVDCVPSTRLTDAIFKERLRNIERFLKVAVEAGRLVQTRRLNLTSGTHSALFASVRKLPHFSHADPKSEVYFEAEVRDERTLHLRVEDPGRFRHDLVFEAPGPIDFKEVTRLSRWRTDPARLNDRDCYCFLVEARVNGKSVKLRGTSRYQGDDHELSTPRARGEAGAADTPGVVCSGVSKVGRYLPVFLNAMIEREDFRQEGGVLDKGGYETVFWNTPLYDGSQDEVTYRNDRPDKFRITILLFDEFEYRCSIDLRIRGDRFTIDDLLRFDKIRVDQDRANPGTQFRFLIDGIVDTADGPVAVTVEGSSCYPITECVKKTCNTYVYEVCYLSETDSIYNRSIPTLEEIQHETDSITEALNKTVQPVWRPNSTFAVEIKTRDEVTGGNNPTYDRSYFFGFKTAGGLGFFHNFLNKNQQWRNRADYQALVDQDQEDTYQLARLNHYIDYSKSYPNADGRLTHAKPLFYINPELLLFFTDDYTYMMFSDWGAHLGNEELNYALEARIKDPVDDPQNPSPFLVGAAWERNDVPRISRDVSTLEHMMQPEGADAPLPCIRTTTILRFGIHSEYVVPSLKPQKAYTALFYAKFKRASQAEFVSREVHRYVFQTSRYGHFSEQIHSYRLTDEDGNIVKEALFNVALSPSAQDLSLAQGILSGSLSLTHALVKEYAHPFDRLVSGALQMASLEAPISTEFNVLRSGQRILGLLVRCPEPFNDPKIDDSARADTIEAQVDGGAPSAFRALHAKDLASVLITNANHSMNMPSGTYRFTFRYKQFDGRRYVVKQTLNDIFLEIS